MGLALLFSPAKGMNRMVHTKGGIKEQLYPKGQRLNEIDAQPLKPPPQQEG